MNPRSRNTIVALVVASVTFMELLDATILTTALPTMANALGVTVIDLKAAITTYLVTLSIFIPISGWIADRLGSKVTLLTAIGLFTASSAACGMAKSLEALVVFRALQGMGGALMTPVARLVIVRLFDRTELVRVAGLVAMPIVLGPVVGPLVGGYLTTHYSWPWIFLVNVPVGLAAMAAIAVLVRNDRPSCCPRFDVRGFLAAGIGLAMLTYVLESLDNHCLSWQATAGLVVVGMVLLVYTVIHCRRTPDPVFDLSLFTVRTFRVGVLQALVGMVACGGVPFLIAILLQLQLGYSALESGAILFCSAVGSLAIKPWVVRLVKRFGTRTILTAYPLGFTAVLMLLCVPRDPVPTSLLVVLMFLYGCCQSVFMNMVNAIPFLDIRPERSSKATSLHGTIQQFSLSLGISFAALLLNGALDARHLALSAAADTNAILGCFHIAFLVMAAVSVGNSLVGLSLKDTPAARDAVVPEPRDSQLAEAFDSISTAF
jgi:EmrB/QacA subfamily drug resistance transporter